MTEEEKKLKNILNALLMAINLLQLRKKEKRKYCVTKNSLQYSLQNSLQCSLQYSKMMLMFMVLVYLLSLP